MSESDRPESFLSRWSRRKLAAAREAEPVPAAVEPAAPAAPGGVPAPLAADPAVPGDSHAADDGAPALPPVEALTFDSDFTAFMKPEVDAGVRQAALRKLLHDPRFNVMDGLDVYIDDYTKPAPLAPELVRQLAHARYLFSPPRTRVNAQGHVEDVPDEIEETVPHHEPADADRVQEASLAPVALEAADTAQRAGPSEHATIPGPAPDAHDLVQRAPLTPHDRETKGPR